MIHNTFLIVDTTAQDVVKQENNNIGTALEDVIINKEDNTNDSTDR